MEKQPLHKRREISTAQYRLSKTVHGKLSSFLILI